MYDTIIICLLLVGISFYVATRLLIVSKKGIYYRWIDKTKKVTSFDYFTSTDGSWIIKSIDYKKLLADNPGDIELEKKIMAAKVLTIITIALGALLVIGAILLGIVKAGRYH